MRDPEFLPSQVLLNGGPFPLTDTMGRAERECAAAIMVHTSHVKGDQWQFLPPTVIGEALKTALAAGIQPWERLNRNPFTPSPDFQDLVKEGYAEFEARRAGYEYEGDPPLRFTEKGLRALRRWLRKPCPKCASPSSCLWWSSDPNTPAWEKSAGPVAGGWLTRKNYTPKIIDDDDFNFAAWKNCREIFICRHHGEFGLVDGALPFFYDPDAYVSGPNGEKLFRL